ncbi:MAG: hypothetical protein EU547_07345 [Promethearchaeota archaeon]|nr:MAG: hypothetical protein EU547_07345 [Candidatus Lokiarchaeota archaeon]
MRIAVDVDGVLLDLMIKYCEVFNERYQTNYKKSDVTRWDFFEAWNIDESKAFEIFHNIYQKTSDVPFIDNKALEVLKDLNKTNHIDIVSARTSKFKKQLKKKLKSHGIKKGTHYENLILVHDKPYDIKLRLDYDIYIDDSPHLAAAVREKNNSILFLYDQPWNRQINDVENIIRVKNWKSIHQKIKNLEFGKIGVDKS